MRLTICLATALVLCAVSTQSDAKKSAAKPAAFQLNETSWTYSDKKEGKLKESIDPDGKYITQTMAGKHVDHGTAVMKDTKACFTSAMTKEGEVCWTTSPVAIGHSMKTTSDKGEKLTVHRIAYVKLYMPK
jgi:hypothetical protein